MLAITSIEHAYIIKKGIEAAALLFRVDDTELLRLHSNNIERQVSRRVNLARENRADLLVSVSDHPEIASVASSMARMNSLTQAT